MEGENSFRQETKVRWTFYILHFGKFRYAIHYICWANQAQNRMSSIQGYQITAKTIIGWFICRDYSCCVYSTSLGFLLWYVLYLSEKLSMVTLTTYVHMYCIPLNWRKPKCSFNHASTKSHKLSKYSGYPGQNHRNYLYEGFVDILYSEH